MSVVEVLNVKLQRTDQTVSWGFNVQGGKDFHCPLMIQKVNPGSLAERCSIQPADYILRIGSLSTEHLTHNQSRDSIVRQGNSLELTLQRGAAPRPDDYAAKLDFAGQHQLMNPESVHQPSLSPQVGVQLGKNKALLTQSYNSPMGLYSSQNIADTLVTSMKGCSTSSSTSVSPVSDACYNDLNARPRPFVPRRSSITAVKSEPRCSSFEIRQDMFRAVPMRTETVTNPHSSEKKFESESLPNFEQRLIAADDPLKSVKMNLKRELQSRLNPNTRHNKENTAINGRLFAVSNAPRQWDAAKRNRSVGNIFRELDKRLSEQTDSQDDLRSVPQLRMNVNDPNAVQAAQHISPKPQVFKSVSNVHTPTGHTQITTKSYSLHGNQFNPPTRPTAASNYPPSQFSMPESYSPVPRPAPPQAAAAISRPQSQQQQYAQPPRQSPYASSPAPSAAAAPRPKNGNRVVGGNRGALGSHIMNMAAPNPNQMPTCNHCHQLVRGPFISAIGRVFCPNHFMCQHPTCGANLETCGFVEENGKLYCEKDFQLYFAPNCFKCKSTIMGECAYALDKSFHPECFVCSHCRCKLGSGTFHMEDGLPYCPKDFAALFAQKCAGCEFPIEAGDQFFEAINQLWHCECFTCQTCHVQLKASGFCVKGTKPYCKRHAF